MKGQISKMQMLNTSIEDIIEELRLDGIPRGAKGYYDELGDYYKLWNKWGYEQIERRKSR